MHWSKILNRQKLLITECYNILKLKETQDVLIIIELCAPRAMQTIELSTKYVYDTTKINIEYQTDTAAVYVDRGD